MKDLALFMSNVYSKPYVVLLRFGSPFNPDGVNNSIYVLAERLVKLGCKVSIIGGFGATENTEELIKVFDIDKVPEVRTLANKCSSRLTLWFKWIKEGARLLRELEPDIIIANGIIPVPDIGFRILRIHDVPEAFYQRLVTKYLLRRYDYYVFSSNTIKSTFLSKFKVPEHKCVIIPLPINLERYRPRPLDEREHAMLFVDGRERRNLHFAIEIFKQVSKQDPDVTMYVVGVRETSQLDYPRGKVVFLGFIGREELRELYSRVKLLLIPSSYEGFCYPVLEAFASGTPVVGSNAIPSELLIDGYNGFRIRQFEVKHYVEAVLKLLKHDNLWISFQKNAIEKAKECSAETVTLRYIRLYERWKESR